MGRSCETSSPRGRRQLDPTNPARAASGGAALRSDDRPITGSPSRGPRQSGRPTLQTRSTTVPSASPRGPSASPRDPYAPRTPELGGRGRASEPPSTLEVRCAVVFCGNRHDRPRSRRRPGPLGKAVATYSRPVCRRTCIVLTRSSIGTLSRGPGSLITKSRPVMVMATGKRCTCRSSQQ